MTAFVNALMNLRVLQKWRLLRIAEELLESQEIFWSLKFVGWLVVEKFSGFLFEPRVPKVLSKWYPGSLSADVVDTTSRNWC
jgi:hypothetical protein